MKKLTKLVIFALFALISMFLFLSCHGKMVDKNIDSATNYSSAMTEFSVPESFDSSKQYEITFWAKSDSNKIQTAVYKKAVELLRKMLYNVSVRCK